MANAAALRAAFDGAASGTVGIEDEIMLLDPATLELAPVAAEVLARAGSPREVKLELPASQLEVVTPVRAGADELAAPLLQARRRVAELCAGLACPAAAAVHPFSPARGELNHEPRYAHTLREYGPVAARQLVCATQVHVALGDADTTLAVYNAARSHLPALAALAANGPIHLGHDSGMASVRPEICRLLPRQGVPPPLAGWDELAAAYRWGATAGAFAEPRTWWWELRPHPRYGTLEFRVPDAQSTVADAVALAAVIQALCLWLAAQHRAGALGPPAETWRIEENRWAAARHGAAGHLADLDTGRPRPTAVVLRELLDQLQAVAEGCGAARGVAHARALVQRGGAELQREVFGAEGARGVARWLAARFCQPPEGY